MSKDPHWTRDELILALDLYFRFDDVAKTDETHPDILELSRFLRSLPIHSRHRRTEKFRSPSSVSMKIFNIMRLDPRYGGRGLSAGSKRDKEVWDAFHNDRDGLTNLANAIRKNSDAILNGQRGSEDDEEAFEGQILATLHRSKERSTSLARKKKRNVLRKTGRLECEVCSFDFAHFYGRPGVGIAECHHIVPLAELDRRMRTKLSDLAIVCANCHRVLHGGRPRPTMAALREMLAARGSLRT